MGDGERRRRYIVGHNPDEQARQEQHRAQLLEELEAELSTLRAPDSSKAHSKRMCELRTSERFGRYLREGRGGALEIDRAAVREAARYDGKWVVTSNDDTLSPEDMALGYKQLMRVEQCWRSMKSGLRMRPVYHWKPHRIRAHLTLCVLALLLERVAEIRAGDTWRNIVARLDTIKVVEYERGEARVQQTTEVRADVRSLLEALRASRAGPTRSAPRATSCSATIASPPSSTPSTGPSTSPPAAATCSTSAPGRTASTATTTASTRCCRAWASSPATRRAGAAWRSSSRARTWPRCRCAAGYPGWRQPRPLLDLLTRRSRWAKGACTMSSWQPPTFDRWPRPPCSAWEPSRAWSCLPRSTRIRRAVRAFVVVALAKLLRLLPYGVACALGRSAGSLAFRLAGGLRRIALDNLARALPERPEAERWRLAHDSMPALALAGCRRS